MAFSCVMRLTVVSSVPASLNNAASSSGACGQLLSECGKSDSQHTVVLSNSSSSLTPTRSPMKQDRKCLRKTSVGPSYPLGKVAFVQPPCRLWVCSARHRKYGIQPMSPSVSEKRRFGKRSQTSDQMNSTMDSVDISGERFIATLAGASVLVRMLIEREAEPTCRHKTVPSSQAASYSGSQ